jgi:hypothetical protein
VKYKKIFALGLASIMSLSICKLPTLCTFADDKQTVTFFTNIDDLENFKKSVRALCALVGADISDEDVQRIADSIKKKGRFGKVRVTIELYWINKKNVEAVYEVEALDG